MSLPLWFILSYAVCSVVAYGIILYDLCQNCPRQYASNVCLSCLAGCLGPLGLFLAYLVTWPYPRGFRLW